MLKNVVISLWIVALGALFLYSFTQVDLGLTLNRASFVTHIQKSFQYVGYFNRPLSALLASFLFIFLFSMYCITLFLVWKNKIGLRVIILLIALTSGILFFSYNAFSYDLFNYMFDARILTNYGENPYIKKALDFPQDPYLGFMHWTHRTYPYGPLWLFVTVPLSFLGIQVFILTFYLFKFLMVSFYLGCCYMVYKISKHLKHDSSVLVLSFFALNPLVIIESLVSAHHDLVMMLPALIGIYILFQKKYITSYLFLFVSIGIKFATGLLLPIFLWYSFSKRKNKDDISILLATILMTVAVILASYRTTFQPWYLLFVLPFASLLVKKYFIVIPVLMISFLSLFQYIPYIYSGNYDVPIPQLMNEMLIATVICSGVVTAGYKLLLLVRKK